MALPPRHSPPRRLSRGRPRRPRHLADRARGGAGLEQVVTPDPIATLATDQIKNRRAKKRYPWTRVTHRSAGSGRQSHLSVYTTIVPEAERLLGEEAGR